MSKACLRLGLTLLVTLVVYGASVPRAFASSSGRRSLATVTGSVHDGKGNPLAGALVMLLREGADDLVKQTRSAADGSFIARVPPGRYILRAVADGYNAFTFDAVQINSRQELVYRFNLEAAGEGRTTAEQRRDRDDPKYTIRAAQRRRSILQLDEGDGPVEVAASTDSETTPETADTADSELLSKGSRSRAQGMIETYASASADPFVPDSIGVDFAIANPISEQFDLILAGQFDPNALESLEAIGRLRVGPHHRLSAKIGGAHLPVITKTATGNCVHRALDQISVGAVDEWTLRDGVVVVLGFDYSRFVDAGKAGTLSPRLGIAYDANARTRLKAAYAPGDTQSAESVAEFEDGPVVFKEGRPQVVSFAEGRAVMERSRRLEFGIERVLDNSSSIEATAFFDTTDDRGVGLLSIPVTPYANENNAALLSVANQQGAARGVRVVYTRRLNRFLKASAGYSFGRGQQLAPEAASAVAPTQLFRDGFFQTTAAQLDADLRVGTRVRTVLRFSPSAAVFAIDPFAGQLAVYDPSLSVIVTQDLPTFGLPVRAEAIIDARNLFDTQSGIDDGDTLTLISATRRSVRGGISVRF